LAISPAVSVQAAGRFHFGPFTLDSAERLLTEDGRRLDLSARYFDALALLVANPGALVAKQRFLDEVWRGVPVTDEALTQCIRSLRKALGDDAARPRFIETVPKHGYRFVAEVERESFVGAAGAGPRLASLLRTLGFGSAGGAIAGLVGGIAYGLAGAAQPLAPGVGAFSLLAVLVSIALLIAIVGSAGVALGIAIGRLGGDSLWSNVAGGAIGGAVVGAAGRLVGIDAFRILVGTDPGNITGAFEGLLLGAAIGLGCWLARERRYGGTTRRVLMAGAACGAAAGAVIVLLGGKLMGGSLAQLDSAVPASRLDLGRFGRVLGEGDFGLLSQLLTAVLEAGLFAACVVAAIVLADRRSTVH
jgi:DNA-binding winged helix-turn-helix (wHTH) protein